VIIRLKAIVIMGMMIILVQGCSQGNTMDPAKEYVDSWSYKVDFNTMDLGENREITGWHVTKVLGGWIFRDDVVAQYVPDPLESVQ